MKILFLTTYDVVFCREHFFTREVCLALSDKIKKDYNDELVVATIITNEHPDSDFTNNADNSFDYRIINACGLSYEQQVLILMDHIRDGAYDIVHSNMTEGIDIDACRRLNIPIATTIHIGGFICPRGGGFLRYNDKICNEAVGDQCAKCMAKDMPFPRLTYVLHCMIPSKFKIYLAKKLSRFLFYITPFLRLTTEPIAKRKFVELANYTHIIAADKRLIKILKLNGVDHHVHLLPHGVKQRRQLPMPALKENIPVKFYFLGRAEYSKGLHIIINALKDIPNEDYELHVIGDTAHLGKHSKAYLKQIKRRAKNMNVFFEGRVPNDKLENTIKDYHVMIHSAIFLEIYGIAIAESLSMGRPVLATKCGGAEMQIKDGVNGWLIPPNDVESMRKTILHILANRKEIIEFGANAKLPMPLPEYINRLTNLYQDIIVEKNEKNNVGFRDTSRGY